MDLGGHALRYTQRVIRALKLAAQTLRWIADTHYAWLILEELPDVGIAQAPRFSYLLNREVLFEGLAHAGLLLVQSGGR